MATLKYVDGDATEPIGDGLRVIPHIVNDIGAWGSGFVIGVSNKWPEPEALYRQRFEEDGGMQLGHVDFVPVENNNIVVANMCAQHQTRSFRDLHGGFHVDQEHAIVRPPIRYGALTTAMKGVASFVKVSGFTNGSIHAPMFGSARAGGNFEVIEAMILEIWVDQGINVTVYRYEE